jgi:hypothetical protein
LIPGRGQKVLSDKEVEAIGETIKIQKAEKKLLR